MISHTSSWHVELTVAVVTQDLHIISTINGDHGGENAPIILQDNIVKFFPGGGFEQSIGTKGRIYAAVLGINGRIIDGHKASICRASHGNSSVS